MKSMQKGFTLIELMIVVAIIAILAAIAIPAYQDYITKSQFTESQTVADGMKTPIQEYFTQSGQCPALGQNGMAAANSYTGKYVTSVALNAGTATVGPVCDITVTFKALGSVSQPLAGQTVTFKGSDNGGTFVWACSAAAVADKYKPATCR
jgi:type IV pilus assembly protein PilA